MGSMLDDHDRHLESVERERRYTDVVKSSKAHVD